jgi:hypothetical protein
MIAVIGILSCVTYAGIGIAVASVVTTTVLTVKGQQDAKDAADRNEQRQDAANKKAEDRAKGLARLQSYRNASDELKTRQSVGGSILLQQLLSDENNKKANRLRAENGLTSNSNKPNWNYGAPAKASQASQNPAKS